MSESTVTSRHGWGWIASRALGLSIVLTSIGMLMLLVQGYRPLVVYSGSMAPAIPAGSVVVVKPVAAESLNIGDVISFRLEEGRHLVTHRIQARQLVDGKWVYQTKGDAKKFPDPQPFVVENVVGKVAWDVPWLGYAIVYTSNPLARFGIVAILIYAALRGFQRKSKVSGADLLPENPLDNGNEDFSMQLTHGSAGNLTRRSSTTCQ